jgi:hypothetical protein
MAATQAYWAALDALVATPVQEIHMNDTNFDLLWNCGQADTEGGLTTMTNVYLAYGGS